jgi:hypothetical protein
VNNYDQTIKQLIETSPSWDRDGGGVRGRTVAPIIGGASVSGGLPEYVPQQFSQQSNQSFRRSVKPFSDLSLDGGGTASGSVMAHPFQVRLETNDEGTPLYIIEFNSNLYTGLTNYNKLSITGLNFLNSASTGFLSLFGVVNDGVVTSASIVGPEEIPSDRIDIVSGEQSSFNYQIAYIFEDGDAFRVRQLCFQDLTLIDVCVNGTPCKYPFAV